MRFCLRQLECFEGDFKMKSCRPVGRTLGAPSRAVGQLNAAAAAACPLLTYRKAYRAGCAFLVGRQEVQSIDTTRDTCIMVRADNLASGSSPLLC